MMILDLVSATISLTCYGDTLRMSLISYWLRYIPEILITFAIPPKFGNVIVLLSADVTPFPSAPFPSVPDCTGNRANPAEGAGRLIVLLDGALTSPPLAGWIVIAM